MRKLSKKEKSGTTKNALLKRAGLIAAALLIGVSAVFAFTIPGLGKSERVQPAQGAVIIPIARVSDGKAHFYRLADDGKEIGFFVVKGSDGKLHTAFDACDVCFHEKKGYVQQGDYLVCKNCNKKFAINMLGPGNGGGCNPSYLSHTEDNRNVIVKVADLNSGARLF
jgi:uncharacterized membrane protein